MSTASARAARLFVTIAVAGAFATLLFELFGQTLSPLLGFVLPTFGPKLPPAAIMNQAIGRVGTMDVALVSALGLGFATHIFLKVLIYPTLWTLAVRRLARRYAPQIRLFGAATLYGVFLWIVSVYVVAHLMAGAPAFLGFTDLTWTALWAHLAYAWCLALIVWWRTR